jgi:hypothetical protein
MIEKYMSIIQYTSNLTVVVGGTYDSTKYMLGNILPDNTQELIPLLSDSEIKTLKNTVITVGFKVYDIGLKILYTWSGSDWIETNDAVANSLSINTSLGQFLVNMTGSVPSTGQVLTALSPYSAAWENSVAGVPPVAGESGLFLTNNGTSVFWGSPFPNQTPYTAGGYYLYTNGSTVSWELTPTWLANPMTASGDLIVGGTSGSAGKLAAGSVGQSLTVVSSGILGWKTLVPAITSGTTGQFLTNNGTVANWASINQVPAMSVGVSNYILSNNGTISQWIINTNPPSISGQAGNFLTNNGSVMSWAAINQVPGISGSSAGKFLTNDGSSYSWASALANPMTTYGDLIVGGLSGTSLRLGIGSINQVLTVLNSTTLSWETPLINPMTFYGDLILGGASGSLTKLSIGSVGQVLTVYTSSGGYNLAEWVTPVTLANPMTTVGDIIYGTTSGTPVRLGIGTSGTVLTSTSGIPAWTTIIPPMSGATNGEFLTNNGSTVSWGTIPNQLPTISSGTTGWYLTNNGSVASWSTIPVGFTNPMTTTGDMIAANAGGVAARLSIGSTGQVLTVVSGGPSWAAIPSQLPSQTGYSGYYLTTNGSIVSWSQITQLVPAVSVGNTGYVLESTGSSYAWTALTNQVPSVSGQSGKYLYTDGTNLLWSPISTLPSVTGQAGKILSTDGTTVYWISESSSASLGTVPFNFTSGSLAINTSQIYTVSTTCYTFQILTISVNTPSRIRFYGTNATATSDLSRLSSTTPSGNVGLMAEFVFTSTQLSWICSPVPICFNNDSILNQNIYMTIQNLGNSTSTITVSATILKLE